MTLNKILPLAGLGILVFIPNSFALGQAQYVEQVGGPGSFPIVQQGVAASLFVDSNDFAGVLRAANNLQADIARVTGLAPTITHNETDPGKNVVIIGTIGKSRIIDRLIRERKIDASPIAGKWESFFIQVVPEPLPGVANGLVIVGSDKRGTIYGIYDLSEQMGVSPWYWWADVPVGTQGRAVCEAGQICAGTAGGQISRHFFERRSAVAHRLGKEKYRRLTTINSTRKFLNCCCA